MKASADGQSPRKETRRRWKWKKYTEDLNVRPRNRATRMVRSSCGLEPGSVVVRSSPPVGVLSGWPLQSQRRRSIQYNAGNCRMQIGRRAVDDGYDYVETLDDRVLCAV